MAAAAAEKEAIDDMKREKSCGALVVRKNGENFDLVLLRHRFGGHWSFPKGHVEAGESERQTALREVREETGLAIRLLEQLDAAGNLRFILGRDYDSVQAAAMLAELGLGDVNGKPVRAFSGGMRRRLALARALLARSDALALDEPFAGLDGETRQRAWNCILHRRGRRPVLLVTHDEADAAGLGAQIVCLV